MIKISGRHKSIPREIKISLNQVLDKNAKVIMEDICSCRHAYKTGRLKIVEDFHRYIKLRAYYGSGVVNLFIKFESSEAKDITKSKIESKW